MGISILFGLITLSLVIAIYSHLYFKKKIFRRNQAIHQILNEAINTALISDDNIDKNDFNIPQLNFYLRKRSNRQFVIECLIDIKKNLIGQASEKVIEIYNILGLKKDSLKKFNDPEWNLKTRGIYELYMMNQKDMISKIFDHTNDKNEYVRMEAQIASINFLGFRGLSFLNKLTRPIHQWQQLKVIEQLGPLDPEEFDKMSDWLMSKNDYVVLFALKLADIYRQMSCVDQVAQCLLNPNEKIRRQAIITLARIDTGNTTSILKEIYLNESTNNKRTILHQFNELGTIEDTSFLIEKLYEEKDSLKLEAVRAIVKCDPDGWNLLKILAENDQVLTSIMRQVKYEKMI